MTKTLLLIRHAQAESKEPGMNDLDRSLNEQGVQEAVKIGRYIFMKELNIERLLTSHANRARETAMLIGEQFKIDTDKIVVDEELYEASARILLDKINQIEENLDCVVLIGHNPSLTFFCEYICNQPVGFLPPGGLIHLEYREIHWDHVSKESGVLIETKYPEQIVNM